MPIRLLAKTLTRPIFGSSIHTALRPLPELLRVFPDAARLGHVGRATALRSVVFRDLGSSKHVKGWQATG